MDLEDALPRRQNDALVALQKEDLDRLSRDELAERIAGLNAEIARTQAKLDGASKFRSAAEAFFRQ